jgi:hypothetical protein
MVCVERLFIPTWPILQSFERHQLAPSPGWLT